MKWSSLFVVMISIVTSSAQHQINKPNAQKMENENYTSTLLVDQNASAVYQAIQQFSQWWSEEIEGSTNVLGETFFYHYKDVHLCKIKLIETIPNEKLVYLVVDNQFNFTEDQSEWINTLLIFDISKQDEKTQITFTHKGLHPNHECYKVCNEAWTHYIQDSLYQLITTGIGLPNPKDQDGFNAELVEKWKLGDDSK